ncbi:MAG TPA: YciC family protein [Solirubrobacterales bacterium]|nr:YciC family protein [Solirubrobacterales bacterium]
MTPPPPAKLSPREVFGEMWRIYKRRWTFLVPAAVVVLLPQSIFDGVLEGSHVEHLRTLLDFATAGVALLTAAVNLLGQAVYAGLTAAAVVDWRAGQPLPSPRTLIRSMPIKRLIALDLLITIGFAIGFLFLVVPGLIFLTYLAIAPAILKLEHRGVWESMRRSVDLVRGQAGRVFVTVVGAIAVTEVAVQAIAAPFEGIAELTAVNLAAEGLLQPIEGLAIAVVAIHLLELRGEAAPPSAMAEALVGDEAWVQR